MNTARKNILGKWIRIGLLVILLLAVVLGILWNRHLNKSALIAAYETPQNQIVYLLGTLHESHFNKFLGYSMEDITSVIANIEPDTVLIEAREEMYDEYGVVDGPIDMTVVYSYCLVNDIKVGMVDWWVVDNEFKENSTNVKRDDKIFENINRKVKTLPAKTTILVVCGSGHFYEQSERFIANGFAKKLIPNKSDIFVSKKDGFTYPDSLEDQWEKRAYFYAYTFPQIIENDPNLSDNIKSQFTDGNHDSFYHSQMAYNTLFRKNMLYK
ncbi:hypothetical protein [Acetobacterium wieringae]|uniref:hypothetical protein n=1 Tax=Acetobacterium wieringae TaxID=52694 RepID=UPI0031587E0D